MKDKNADYPIPDDEVDIYSVDTRIWDRMKELMDGMGGDSGGPHTHDIYADKDHDHGTHEHDGDYAPSTHQHPHDHPHDHDGSYAPSGHTHDLTHTHDDYAAGDHTHDLTHDHTEYADAQTLADHLANHPSGGDGSGGSYDDTALKARVKTNEDDIASLELENNSQNLNIQANTDALADKADTDHTHPPQDLTHTHPEYFPSGVEYDLNGNPLPLPYQDAKTLGEEVDGKADEQHTHDTTHDHDADYQPLGNYADATHTHPEYEGGGSGGGITLGAARSIVADRRSFAKEDYVTPVLVGNLNQNTWPLNPTSMKDIDWDNLDYSAMDAYYTESVDGYLTGWRAEYLVLGGKVATKGYVVTTTFDDPQVPFDFTKSTALPTKGRFLKEDELLEATPDGLAMINDYLISQSPKTNSRDGNTWYVALDAVNDFYTMAFIPPSGLEFYRAFYNTTVDVWFVIPRVGYAATSSTSKVVATEITPITFPFEVETQEVANVRLEGAERDAFYERVEREVKQQATRQARIDAFLESVANG